MMLFTIDGRSGKKASIGVSGKPTGFSGSHGWLGEAIVVRVGQIPYNGGGWVCNSSDIEPDF